MRKRVVLTVLVATVLFATMEALRAFMPGIEAKVAVEQLSDSILTYGASSWFITHGIGWVLFGLFVLLMAAIWRSPIKKWTRKYLHLGFSAVLLVGCVGPAKVLPIVEIEPNETAFLVPMEGASKEDQARFMSEEFLQENKV